LKDFYFFMLYDSKRMVKEDFMLNQVVLVGSQCGLCDTYYIAHVKDACAFLGDGMSRVEVNFWPVRSIYS
jgi:hypothetical protein